MTALADAIALGEVGVPMRAACAATGAVPPFRNKGVRVKWTPAMDAALTVGWLAYVPLRDLARAARCSEAHAWNRARKHLELPARGKMRVRAMARGRG